MRILVTNDDGVHAEGLSVLVEVLRGLGGVDVIAPDRNRSGASNSLTLDAPLRVRTLPNGYFSVEGTPTDCVHLALTSSLLPQLPDIVVSGINAGANLGDDVLYSGTVAAAIEGRSLGLPAVAISLVRRSDDGLHHFQTAARVAERLVRQLKKVKLPAATILNVNVPDVPPSALQGFEVTRLGTRHRAEPTLAYKDPRGTPAYWIGLPGPEQDAGPGTDFHAIKADKAAITPIQVDMTHYHAFDALSRWVGTLEW